MSSNTDSYARIPTSTLAAMIDGLLDKTEKVCKANTAAHLVAHYDDYVDSKWRKVERLFGGKTKDFLTWVKMEREAWKSSGIFDNPIFTMCRDYDSYGTLITGMKNLAKYSDQHALLSDTDLAQLTAAVAKGEKVDASEAYLAKLEAAYPGIRELL